MTAQSRVHPAIVFKGCLWQSRLFGSCSLLLERERRLGDWLTIYSSVPVSIVTVMEHSATTTVDMWTWTEETIGLLFDAADDLDMMRANGNDAIYYGKPLVKLFHFPFPSIAIHSLRSVDV